MDIEQIHNLYGEKIQTAIAQADWDVLEVLLKERQCKLEYFFANNLSNQDNTGVAETIKKIQSEDVVFLRVVQAQKKELEKQFLSLKQNRKSLRAYQAN